MLFRSPQPSARAPHGLDLIAEFLRSGIANPYLMQFSFALVLLLLGAMTSIAAKRPGARRGTVRTNFCGLIATASFGIALVTLGILGTILWRPLSGSSSDIQILAPIQETGNQLSLTVENMEAKQESGATTKALLCLAGAILVLGYTQSPAKQIGRAHV